MNSFQDYKQFLLYMEDNYEEEDQLIIENFISYYINVYKGFGRYNCESTYQEGLKNDMNGQLHKFAIIGFNFEKKNYDERTQTNQKSAGHSILNKKI